MILAHKSKEYSTEYNRVENEINCKVVSFNLKKNHNMLSKFQKHSILYDFVKENKYNNLIKEIKSIIINSKLIVFLFFNSL